MKEEKQLGVYMSKAQRTGGNKAEVELGEIRLRWN